MRTRFQFCEQFGVEVPRPLKMISTNWSGDKHTFGAYSFPTKLCEPSDFDGLSEGYQETITKAYFSAENTQHLIMLEHCMGLF